MSVMMPRFGPGRRTSPDVLRHPRCGLGHPPRAESQGLHDAPDPSVSYQLSGFARAAHLETFRESDRPESAGLCDRLLDLVELVQRDTPGLVGDDILAVGQGLDRDCGALVGNCGCDDTSIEGSRSRLVWSSIHLTSGQRRRTVCDGRSGVLGAEPDELTALIEQTLDLPESMCMVQADGGKPNWRTALVCRAH
jgi:hypothetical protein